MSRYKALGVDVKKEGIAAFKGVVDNLFPGAFCVVTRDPTTPGRGLVSHADSAGSKPIISYICYKESGASATRSRGIRPGSRTWLRTPWP
jgi:hypothetical protein